MKNFGQLFKMIRPYWGRFVFAIVSLIIVTMTIVATTALIQPIFDKSWTNTNFDKKDVAPDSVAEIANPKFDTLEIARKYLFLERFLPPDLLKPLNLITILLITVFSLKGIFSYFGNYLMASVGQGVVRDIRNQLYGSIIDKPISFFRRRSTGSLISRIASDVERIQYAVSQNLADLFREALTVVGLTVFIFYLNSTFAIVSIFAAPVVLFPIVQFGKRLRKTSRMGQEQMESLINRLHETFSGIRIVKAFCAEKIEKERFRSENDNLLKVILKGIKYYSLTSPVMEIIGSIVVAYMIYWGSVQIESGEMTVGLFATVIGALYGLYNPIKKLSRINNNMQQAFAAIERVQDILNISNEIEETSDAVALTHFDKNISFNTVSFSYVENNILFDIDFSVKKGEVCAIVGLSGSGKTTLVNLLPRFDEVTKGSIDIDGINIKDITLSSLRSNIGIVTQETILFNESVRDNIAYGNGQRIDDEDIIRAAKAAHAHEFIMKMTDQYETVIGEKGVKISGGERQRIAIARALIKNPPILILDEATSALDSESERLVQSALENLMSHRTTFVIAHRLSTVRKADVIVVLNEGRLAEIGTHDKLLEKGGLYKKLYTLQFADIGSDKITI